MTSITITTLQARKQAVSERFGRAAASYDAHGKVQTVCANHLIRTWPSGLAPSGDNALDLGCATALQAESLLERWPDLRWTGLDLSPAMLERADKLGRTGKHYQPLCADAEQLPLATASQALVFSNFALQWCRPQRVAEELARVLVPDGSLLLCLPLAGSLRELKDSWAVADNHSHVNFLPTERDWRQVLTGAGLEPVIWRTGLLPEYYPDVKSLARNIQNSGVGHIPGRSHGLTGKSAWAAMTKAYERYREDAGLPLTWRVLVTHAIKSSAYH